MPQSTRARRTLDTPLRARIFRLENLPTASRIASGIGPKARQHKENPGRETLLENSGPGLVKRRARRICYTHLPTNCTFKHVPSACWVPPVAPARVKNTCQMHAGQTLVGYPVRARSCEESANWCFRPLRSRATGPTDKGSPGPEPSPGKKACQAHAGHSLGLQAARCNMCLGRAG